MIRALRYGLLLAVVTPLAWGQDPPLPPGLGPAPPNAEEKQEAGPALPPGLAPPRQESETAAPPLPPGLGAPAAQESAGAPSAEGDGFAWPALHGFWELRGGLRLQNDPAQPRDAILGESRWQLEFEKAWDRLIIDFTGDTLADGVLEEADFDLRRLRLTWTPVDTIDIRAGRQILTWGTGDLLFINDLFPKDYQSFLIGRDQEYLKAPSDALKVGWFNHWMNVEVVYTPQFDPDRFITGERISYYNPMLRRNAGRDNQVGYNAPDDPFADDEWALRLYRTVGKFELALYGYAGFWKSPGGQRLLPPRATFPRLAVYGASIRGPVGKAIINAEIGYYDSRDDRPGKDPFANNSELRFLLGYEREIGKELTLGLQYYLEHILDYSAYRSTLPFFLPARDEDRHLVTLRLTKLLMDQNLTLSLFVFYSPSDSDAYFRPKASYKVNDALLLEAGANLFTGASPHTFFGQLEDNSNLYVGVRYSF